MTKFWGVQDFLTPTYVHTILCENQHLIEHGHPTQVHVSVQSLSYFIWMLLLTTCHLLFEMLCCVLNIAETCQSIMVTPTEQMQAKIMRLLTDNLRNRMAK
jgi:hypothetical protein